MTSLLKDLNVLPDKIRYFGRTLKRRITSYGSIYSTINYSTGYFLIVDQLPESRLLGEYFTVYSTATFWKLVKSGDIHIL